MTPAWVFGLAGLIPFVGLAGIMAVGPAHWYAASQVLLSQYGALILSFVGALHWGYAVQQEVKGKGSVDRSPRVVSEEEKEEEVL